MSDYSFPGHKGPGVTRDEFEQFVAKFPNTELDEVRGSAMRVIVELGLEPGEEER